MKNETKANKKLNSNTNNAIPAHHPLERSVIGHCTHVEHTILFGTGKCEGLKLHENILLERTRMSIIQKPAKGRRLHNTG